MVKDSIINFNVSTKGGEKQADELFHDYRRKLRKLRTEPEAKSVKKIDAMIVELNEAAQQFEQLGSTSLAAQYLALMGRGQFMRGKVDQMWETIGKALSLDPYCEFALLHLGEFHANTARRIDDADRAKEEWERSARYMRICRENADNDGARNNAAFQLCQALIELGEDEEAGEVKQWLLERVSNLKRREEIENLQA